MKKIVVITDMRSPDALSCKAHLEGLGYQVECVPENVCLWHEEELTAFAAPLEEGLLGVIHPAPPAIKGGIQTVTEEEWALARDEGAMAAWCVSKVFGGILRKKKQGCVIYLNSIHAEKPVGLGALFSMGCGAVQMLNREFNQDYGPDFVRSYFIQRGIRQDETYLQSNVSNLYYGVDLRYPERVYPKEGSLNGLLAFLLTDEAGVLSGSDLKADGGMTMYYNHRRAVEGRPYHVRSEE